MRFWLGFMLLAATISSVAQERKNELTLSLGGTVTPSRTTPAGDAVDISSGVSFGINFAHRITSRNNHRFWFEVPLVASPRANVRSSEPTVPNNYATLFVTPGIRWNFSPER